MQIVIDIPDKVYGLLKYFEESMGFTGKKEDENDDVKTTLIKAVLNGTPLPKGHGDLIDKKVAYKKFYARCLAGAASDVFAETPTIIEADKEKDEC